MSAPVATPPRAVGSPPPEQPAQAPQGRIPAIGAVLVALVALVAAPFQGVALGPGTLRLVAGSAEVLHDDTWAPLVAGARVGLDTWVRAAPGGPGAELALSGGGAELRPGATVRLVDRDRLELDRGSLLLEVDVRWLVDVDLVAVAVVGAARIDLGPVRRVGVYDGGVGVSVGARGSVVAPYEQVDLADTDRLEPRPLRYDPDDPWDARLLAGAIAVDDDVAALQRGLRAQYGTALQTADFYRDFLAVDDTLAASLPGLAPRERADRFGPPAPTLVAVVVATVLVEHARMGPGEATDAVRGARAAGATFGLVLAAEGLGTRELGAASETALRRRAIAVEEGRAAPVVASEEPTGTDEDDGDPGGGGGSGTTDPDPDPAPSDPDPYPDDPGGPVQDPVDEVDESLEETVEETDRAIDELLDSVAPPGDDGEGTIDLGDGDLDDGVADGTTDTGTVTDTLAGTSP